MIVEKPAKEKKKMEKKKIKKSRSKKVKDKKNTKNILERKWENNGKLI